MNSNSKLPINLEDLRQGKGVSRRYRNRRIGEFLKELDLTEGRSTGISKILKAMKSNGSPLPEFETDEARSYFLIRLPVHLKAETLVETTQETTQKTPMKTPMKTVEGILSLVQERPELTLDEMAEALGKSFSAVARAARKLREEGRLRYVGPQKGGHWEVKNNGEWRMEN